MSKQALSKARTHLDPDMIKDSFVITAKTLSECEDLELYKGKFRLCAFDGSDLALDNAAELLAHFGGSGRNADCAMAMASLCYDPLNNIEMSDGGMFFLMRVRAKFSIDFNEAKRQKVMFRHNGKPYWVRVFNITLPSGETEQLVTNLPVRYLKADDAGDLYFKR